MEETIAKIGYTPQSAVNRTISDGSQYDSLFPKSDGKKTLLKKNGEVDDTVQFMKKIVNDYNFQTKKISQVIAVKNTDGSLNEIESIKALWNFVVKYIKYNIEAGEQLRTPSKTWYDAQIMARQYPDVNNPIYSADCDCMSIFCGCVLLNWHIPFSFRITAYTDILGLSHGWQHVYVIAHCKSGDIICDPVYYEFNKEKIYEKQMTIPMSLNGCDIYALSGIPENVTEYVENLDGTLGELSGKKRKAKKAAKKAKKAARKAAKREKKAAKKAIKKAKKSGDKEALKAAKAAKKAAKKKIAANRTGIAKAVSKVGKGIAKAAKAAGKFIKKSSFLVPRGMFLLLLRLNFRGMARKFSNNQNAYNKFAKTWKKVFGGKESKLKKAIEKGKSKKALFGSKKTVGDLHAHLYELGCVLGDLGLFDKLKAKFRRLFKKDQKLNGANSLGLGELGFTTAAVGSAIASAMPIVKKVMGVFQQIGDFLPETAEEAEEQGFEVEEVDESTEFEQEPDDMEDDEVEIDDSDDSEDEEEIEDADEDVEEEEDEDEDVEETMEGYYLNGYEDGVYYVDDTVDGLGNLGRGLFKKIFNAGKNIVSKIKSKKANKSGEKSSGGLLKKLFKKKDKSSKKATKKAKKTAKKATKKAKKQEKKTAKSVKKAEKKQTKATKKAAKKQKKIATKAAKADNNSYDEEIKMEDGTTLLPATAKSGKFKNFVNKAKNVVSKSMSVVRQQAPQNNDEEFIMDSTKTEITPMTTNNESFVKKHKTKLIIGGVGLLALGIGIAVMMKKKNNSNEPTKKLSGNVIEPIDLS